MSIVRNWLTGPPRAIIVLAVTQVLTWGVLYYPIALIAPLIADQRGWSLAVSMGGFSIGLAVSGLAAPYICGLIDKRGGNAVMALGGLTGACGLIAMALATHPVSYFMAWALIGIGMASNLYDPAFTVLTRLFGNAARGPITLVTFAGGLASTFSWPVTHVLVDNIGWRGALLVFAAIMMLVVVPLHGFALPRGTAPPPVPVAAGTTAPPPARLLPPSGWPFILVACGFGAQAFIASGVSAHLLGMLQRGGLSAATAVTVGAMFGPAQVVSRLIDFLSQGKTHPLAIARGAMALMTVAFVVLALAGVSVWIAVLFAVSYGAANGVMTVARGGLTLTLFGPSGYGRVLGRIGRIAQILQALAPFTLAFMIEQWSDRAVLGMAACCTLIALGCFLALRRPQ